MGVRFADWLTRKYIEWRGQRIGNSASVKEFAKVFGTSQQLMSSWLNGTRTPSHAKYINALVERYGLEVYAVLDMEPPAESLSAYPPEIRGAVSDIVRVLSSTDPADWGEPSTAEAVRAILARYGAKDITIEE